MKTFGECYYDHYEKYFRTLAGREIFRDRPERPSIQVLFFDGVFDGCRVFCSLGLSHYAPEVSQVAEVFLGADDFWATLPTVLANALFFMVQRKMAIGRGVAIAGLEAIDAEFVRQSGKTAFYITTPFGLPKKFGKVDCDGTIGKIYQAFPISREEYAFFCDHGTEEFEDRLQEGEADPLQIRRTPVKL